MPLINALRGVLINRRPSDKPPCLLSGNFDRWVGLKKKERIGTKLRARPEHQKVLPSTLDSRRQPLRRVLRAEKIMTIRHPARSLSEPSQNCPDSKVLLFYPNHRFQELVRRKALQFAAHQV